MRKRSDSLFFLSFIKHFHHEIRIKKKNSIKMECTSKKVQRKENEKQWKYRKENNKWKLCVKAKFVAKLTVLLIHLFVYVFYLLLLVFRLLINILVYGNRSRFMLCFDFICFFFNCFLLKKKHDYRRPYAAASILHMQNYTTKQNAKLKSFPFLWKRNMNEKETINWFVPVEKIKLKESQRERLKRNGVWGWVWWRNENEMWTKNYNWENSCQWWMSWTKCIRNGERERAKNSDRKKKEKKREISKISLFT